MTQQHPITPSPELVRQWAASNGTDYEDLADLCQHVALIAAHWGADQELEACCSVLELSDKNAREFLYSARRPEPLSLKVQALETLKYPKDLWSQAEVDIIRRALEQLDD